MVVLVGDVRVTDGEGFLGDRNDAAISRATLGCRLELEQISLNDHLVRDLKKVKRQMRGSCRGVTLSSWPFRITLIF